MSSSSAIRILPRKKIERHVVTYSSVLSWVLSRRMIQAGSIIFLVILLVSPVLSVFIQGVSTKSLVFTLSLSALPVLFKSKVLLSVDRPAYSSAVTELIGTIWSRKFIATLISYAASTSLYFRGIVSQNVTLYTLQKAEFTEHPEGIPTSLALHQTDKWYLIHEDYLYIYGFMYFAAGVVALLQMKKYTLEVDPRENGLKPFNRLVLRFPKLGRSVAVWAVLALIWPALYYLKGRDFFGGLLTVGFSGTQVLSGFTVRNLLLPLKFLPLFLLWTTCQEVFMAYLSRGPTLKERPISDFARFDKNGTLVNGLSKNTASLTARFAWHELLLIAEHIEQRRISIFKDIDSERVIWDLISAEFVKLIESHIDHLKKSNAEKANHKKSLVKKETHHHSVTHFEVDSSSTAQILGTVDHNRTTAGGTTVTGRSLPIEEKKVPVVVKTTNLFKPESALEKRLSSFVSSLETKSTTRVERAQLKLKHYHASIQKKMTEWFEIFLQTPAGRPLLRTVERKLASQIRNRQTTAFALRGIARMITQSMKEDQNGYVQGTIGRTLDLLDEYALRLEQLIESPPVDRFDTKIKKHEAKPDLQLAEDMLNEVNGAFTEIVQVFEPYFDNLGVSAKVRERSKRVKNGSLPIARTAWIS